MPRTRRAQRFLLAAMTALTLAGTAGCAIMRGQSSVGSYVDDKSVTAAIKAKLLEDPGTGGMSIGVDTLNGTVQLSGFAKSAQERARAEAIARETRGVREVRNALIVRP